MSMKSGCYRFSLQFPSSTMEQRRAGELLERLGSKKSRVIVQALTDYLQKHPGLLESGGAIHVDAAAGLSREEVRALIREELAQGNYTQSDETTGSPTGSDQAEIVESMLDNLGLFG